MVKVGTSSITNERGVLDDSALLKLCGDLAAARTAGHRVVLVSSGAIAAGMPALGLTDRPTDIGTLQALAAVGQPRLVERLSAMLSAYDIVAGQVLLTPYDFVHRSQYLHARDTMQHLLALDVLPIVNENDTIADDEIRYGDNDLLAALVSHSLRADALVLLTDTGGLYTADPRLDEGASLIEEIVEVDAALEQVAGGSGIGAGQRWDGEQARRREDRGVVGRARRDRRRDGGERGRRRARRPAGRHRVRAPRRRACRAASCGSPSRTARRAASSSTTAPAPRSSSGGKSLLAAGVRARRGRASTPTRRSRSSAKTPRCSPRACRATPSAQLRSVAGKRTADLPEGLPHEVVHRDDLVVLP